MPITAPPPPADWPSRWVEIRPEGLYVTPGRFHIDPQRPVPRAVITHGHSDHARGGHEAVLATPETVEIMRLRLGAEAGRSLEPLPYGVPRRVGDVMVTLVPAGHVLGSAQIVVEHHGRRLVVSGDYKREADPTCPPFEPVPCDVFVTEATFALPVFRHPPAAGEIARLLDSVRLWPERCHVIGAYSLGKAQRLIALLRSAGWDGPIPVHGALVGMIGLYERLGVPLGPIEPATATRAGAAESLKGRIVIAPPSAIADRWARRLPDPVITLASGWMRVRQRARQGGVELPLIISDHADWDALIATCRETGAGEVWITHGREEALAHALGGLGIPARALSLVGYGDEE